MASGNAEQYIEGYVVEDYSGQVVINVNGTYLTADTDSDGYFIFHFGSTKITSLYISTGTGCSQIETLTINIKWGSVTDLSTFLRLTASTSQPYIISNLRHLNILGNFHTNEFASASYFMSYMSELVSDDTDGWLDLSNLQLKTGNNSFYTYLNAKITTIKKLGFPSISKDSTANSNCYVLSGLTDIPICGKIYGSFNFGNAPLSLASAKVVLEALQDVTDYGSKTLTLSDVTKAYINEDSPEALEVQEIITQKRLLGWTIVY